MFYKFTFLQTVELNEIIRKVQSKNTYPCTTDADIRFFETQDYVAKNNVKENI